MSRLARLRGDDDLAGRQEAAAERLRQRFEDAFWMEDVGTYALALDAEKRQVDAVGSNPGHALWSGIVSPERAVRVAASFESPGLWSGWGVRTLSRQMAGYNPIGYHLGTVWPHDNAVIAAGLARYGYREQAARVAAAMLESTRYFRDARMPELFCGFGRSESPNPVPYPVACSPQAWAAGAMFWFIQTMLGLHPNAAARTLELVSPNVPSWLRSVRIENLRIGDAVLDLEFRRTDGSTAVDILRRSGDIGVVVRF
jgi:glycogen debranching enzyme